jgi:hypothetical protein
MTELSFNMDVNTYKIEELFQLLDIKINQTMDTDELKKLIKTNSDKMIKQFDSLGKSNISDFFKNVQSLLIGDSTNETLSSTQKTLIEYDNGYTPFTSERHMKNTSSTEMFDSNNGAGNPIHRKTVTKLLNIDSRFRTNYLNTMSTNYYIDLPYPINNVIEMKLSDLELPTTYYPIATANQNNYFWFATYTEDELINNDPAIYYFHVNDGNYYFDNLIIDINEGLKKINTNSTLNGVFTPLPLSLTFDLNYNNLGGVGNGTGIVSFGILPTSPQDLSLNMFAQIVQVDINFNCPPLPGATKSTRVVDPLLKSLYYDNSIIPIEQRFGWMIGYRQNYYSGAIYYKSESILDVLGPKYLFLIVNDFNKSNNVNYLTASKLGMLPDNIIARLSLKGAAFNIQSQNDFSVYSEPRYYYGPVNITKLEIKIVDEFGRIIDLNSNDFSFTLKMTTIYSAT